ENQKLLSAYRGQLIPALQSSYEQMDKAILTLSGGGLALSFTFIQEIVPLGESRGIWLLLFSWTFFAGSILSTLLSFHLSQKAFHRQLKSADEYYLQDKEESFLRANPFSVWTGRLNLISTGFFILAVAAMILFVEVNATRERTKMSDKKDSTLVNIREGAVPPAMQPSGDTPLGAVPPAMQPTSSGPSGSGGGGSAPQGGGNQPAPPPKK
ncbi:MAG: hypothetical protein KC931_23515, partial [Candidatus Omnitrophica bacterium]|nr:hypothetical protein [Candidatus Omnitrophota bacterium]